MQCVRKYQCDGSTAENQLLSLGGGVDVCLVEELVMDWQQTLFSVSDVGATSKPIWKGSHPPIPGAEGWIFRIIQIITFSELYLNHKMFSSGYIYQKICLFSHFTAEQLSVPIFHFQIQRWRESAYCGWLRGCGRGARGVLSRHSLVNSAPWG